MIRAATFSDVNAMAEVVRWAYERSVYAGRLTFDEREVNSTLCQAIQRHGSKSAAGTWVRVSDVGGKVEGLIVGVLHPVYHAMQELMATDLWWISTGKAPARDKVGLMLSLVEWAKRHPKVHEVQSCASDVAGGADAAAKILAKMGFQPCGGLWRMEVQR